MGADRDPAVASTSAVVGHTYANPNNTSGENTTALSSGTPTGR
ncbi:MAG: hypothetical protein ACJ752_04745 [Gaiellaceae bacterium]